MTVNTLLVILVLPAVTFGLLYFPVLTRVTASLASPYPKADIKRRLLAASLDGSMFVTSLYFYQNSGSVWFVVGGAVYLVFREAMWGRSVGKFFAGLAVINLETGRPCGLAGTVRRNLVFLFPGVNVVAVFLEAITVVRDPQGHRLGDRLARTQVVLGFGAKDMVQSLIEWFQPAERPLSRLVRPASGRGRRLPGVTRGGSSRGLSSGRRRPSPLGVHTRFRMMRPGS